MEMLRAFSAPAFLYLCLFYLFLIVALGPYGHGGDLHAFKNWAIELQKGGLHHLYCDKLTDYPPLYIYFLKGFNLLITNENDWQKLEYITKLIPIAFGWLTAVLIYGILALRQQATHTVGLYVLNGAILYNGFIWGQADDVQSFFIVACAVALYYRKPAWAVVAFLLALNMKLQSIVFLPVLGLWWLKVVLPNWKSALGSIGAGIITQIVIFFPLWRKDCLTCLLNNVVETAVGRCPTVSVNAYNIWYILEPRHIAIKEIFIPDTDIFAFGYTYHQWGMVFLEVGMGIIVLTTAYYLFIKPRSWDLEKGLLACGVVGLAFFYLPTQMHERYSHPGLICIAVWAILGKYRLGYWLYGAFSLAYWMNLERVLSLKRFPNNMIIFQHPLYSAALFGMVLVGLTLVFILPQNKKQQ